jgi:hypothetical protein
MSQKKASMTNVGPESVPEGKVQCKYCKQYFNTRGVKSHQQSCIRKQEQQKRTKERAELAAQVFEAEKKGEFIISILFNSDSDVSYCDLILLERQKEKRRRRKERRAAFAALRGTMQDNGSADQFDPDVEGSGDFFEAMSISDAGQRMCPYPLSLLF